MAKFIGNAFSANMVALPSVVRFKEISLEEAKQFLSDSVVSAVGHVSTASLISKLTGIDIPSDRKTINLQVGDQLLIFQLQARLEEGRVLTEEELKALPHKWILVEVVG